MRSMRTFARALVLGGLGLALAGVLNPITPLDAAEKGGVDRLAEYKLGWWGATAIVEGFDDPRVPGVACHMSRTEKGGIGGWMGVANNSSLASIACRQVGPITVDLASLTQFKDEDVFSTKTSFIFKTMHVKRSIDVKRKTIVYLIVSEAVSDASNATAISTVPVMPWRD